MQNTRKKSSRKHVSKIKQASTGPVFFVHQQDEESVSDGLTTEKKATRTPTVRSTKAKAPVKSKKSSKIKTLKTAKAPIRSKPSNALSMQTPKTREATHPPILQGIVPQAPSMKSTDPSAAQSTVTPLPRSSSVTPWKTTGPVDAVAYWVRDRAKSFSKLLKSKKKKAKQPANDVRIRPGELLELERLRAENKALRVRIEQLLDSRIERTGG